MLAYLSKHVFYKLRDWKENSSRLKILNELEKSQWDMLENSRKRQWQKLQNIVRYARDNCEYYNKVLDEHNVPNNIESVDDFVKIPILEKKDIRENQNILISNKYELKDLYKAKTGGSTGISLEVYFNNTCQQARNAAEIRSDMWAGWELGMKRAALWGSPPIGNSFKDKIRNLLIDRRIVLDTTQMNIKTVNTFVEQWRREKPKILFGHAHSIYLLAKYLKQLNVKDIKPEGIISTSMTLLDYERKIIEEILQCKVFNRYGCEEVGLIASECEEHNGMHINIDHLYVEFIKDDETHAKPGEYGYIVVTDLLNKGMPLIRYKVGDVGVVSSSVCKCGRGAPILEDLSGRVADFLIKNDGTKVAGISLVEKTLTRIKGIEQLQIVQENIDKFLLNVVKGNEFNRKAELELSDSIKNIFGATANVTIKYLQLIPNESSGKYRFAKCNI